MKVVPKIVIPYYVSRRCITGANEYRFFCDGQEVGSATAYSFGNFPVYISGAGVKLRSDFDSTIFPGCRRDVRYIDDNELLAELVYNGQGSHSIILGEETIHIQSKKRNYLFYLDGELVAEIRPCFLCTEPKAEEEDWTVRYMMIRRSPVSELMELLMLSFPILQIAP